MIDAKQWLDHSKDLASPPVRGAPKQVKLRRSISAAYYGLFHSMLTAAADELVGNTHAKTAAYSIVYRAFEHGFMRQRCEQCRLPMLPDKVKNTLGLTSFSSNVRKVASAFIALQISRHRADYDPRGKVTPSEASGAYQSATQAILALAQAPADERRLFLLYLLFGAR